jgi:hypothetical protein
MLLIIIIIIIITFSIYEYYPFSHHNGITIANVFILFFSTGNGGQAVAQVVEALC